MANELTQFFDGVGDIADAIAERAPSPGKDAATIISIVMRSAARLAGEGQDPVEAIRRIHAVDPEVDKVLDEREEALRDKFRSGDEASEDSG